MIFFYLDWVDTKARKVIFNLFSTNNGFGYWKTNFYAATVLRYTLFFGMMQIKVLYCNSTGLNSGVENCERPLHRCS